MNCIIMCFNNDNKYVKTEFLPTPLNYRIVVAFCTLLFYPKGYKIETTSSVKNLYSPG